MRAAHGLRSMPKATRLTAATACGLLLCGAAATGERRAGQVAIEHGRGWLTIRAQGAPLEAVLARLASALGAKVVYGGAPPRRTVSVELRREPAVDAVVALLSAQGLDFALQLDASASRIETLFVAGERDAPVAGRPPVEPGASAETAPAEEETDEPEGLIHSPEGDPIAVKEGGEAQEDSSAEPQPTETPTPTPAAAAWPAGPLRSPFAKAPPPATPTPLPAE